MNGDDIRYPMRPLVDHLGGFAATIDLYHWSGTTYKRYVVLGLTPYEADRFAQRAGLHPSALWPTWFADGLTVTDYMFVNRGGWRTAWLAKEAS